MDQIKIGKFITLKRKEKNLTQQQLAEKLGISNKTISKWETGRCMPDYSIVEPLCNSLDISIDELLSGQTFENDCESSISNKNSLSILENLQKTEKERSFYGGVAITSIGIALSSLSSDCRGSDVQDFFCGVAKGLSIGILIVGILVMLRFINIFKKK